MPSELEQRLTSSDYVRLSQYYELNPWGPWRDDLRVAHLTALTFNINRGKGQPSMSPMEFIYDPIAAEERQEKRDQATLAILEQASRAQENG